MDDYSSLKNKKIFRNKKKENDQLISEDENDDDNDNETTFLLREKIKLKNNLSDCDPTIRSNSPFSRNINTPVYDEFDIVAQKSEKKSVMSKLLDFNKKFKYRPFCCVRQTLKLFQKHSAHFSTLKTIILVSYTLFCIFLFSLNDSSETKWLQSVISNKTQNLFSCLGDTSHDLTKSKYLRFQLNGPFIDEQDLSKTDINSGKYVLIDFTLKNTSNPVLTWKLILKNSDKNKFSDNSILIKNVHLKTPQKLKDLNISVKTNAKDFIPFSFNCIQLSDHFNYSVLYSTILLVFVYTLIIFELTHRTLAACLGALGGISIISLVDTEKPSLKTIVTWVEWETILLMFGMMIIVAIFCETGLFDLIAVRIFHFSGTRIWIMVGSLCLLSAVLSAFLDNVTTILLLVPITIRLCEVMSLDPRRIIIAEVVFSNIGGASTAIGDPPNVIITANEVINSKGVDFTNFTFHMFIGSVFVYVICFIHFRLLYADPKNFVKNVETEFEEMKKEINIWTRSFQSIAPITKEEKIVKTLLKEKASQLENLLMQKRYVVKQEFKKSLETKSQEMIESYKITNKPLLIKCSVIFAGALVLFFVDPFLDEIHLSIGWISILSALVLLATSTNEQENGKDNSAQTSIIDFESLMHKIEWSTLIFFAALFIFMKCIEELGLLTFLGNLISDLIKSVELRSDRIAFALILLVVLSAFISSIIDNIPFTTAMIPIIIQLSDQADLPLQPLVYALAFGSCLGGNGSLVGASCNLVAAGISEQHGYKITFRNFFRIGFPIMLSSILVAIVYIFVTCIYFEWY